MSYIISSFIISTDINYFTFDDKQAIFEIDVPDGEIFTTDFKANTLYGYILHNANHNIYSTRRFFVIFETVQIKCRKYNISINKLKFLDKYSDLNSGRFFIFEILK